MKRKIWNQEEIGYLKENYPKFGANKCATDLKRSFHSVSARASILKLESPLKPDWTDEEMDILRQFYSKYGAPYCANLLNRSKVAIRIMAAKLKLNKLNLSKHKLRNKICKTCKKEQSIDLFQKITKNIPPFSATCETRHYQYISAHCDNCRKEIDNKKGHRHYLKHQAKITSEARKRFNTDEYREYARNYARERRKNDVHFRLKDNCRKRIGEALRLKSLKKQHRTMDLIGCSINHLKQHLESQFQEGMTWENHSLHGWHIDHRKPCSSFNLVNPDEQKICFHYTNLQPLWATTQIARKYGDYRSIGNIEKGDKIFI